MTFHFNSLVRFLISIGLLTTSLYVFAQGRNFTVDDNLVREYLDGVYHTTGATSYAPPSRDKFQDVAQTAVSLFEEHTSQNHHGHFVTDPQLTHFIEESRRFQRFESQYNCGNFNSYECYQRKYYHRHEHLSGCHICNGFTQVWFASTSFQPVPFYPSYAYYRGYRLKTYRSGVYYQNQYCDLFYDYDDRRWMFNYGGRGYPLTF